MPTRLTQKTQITLETLFGDQKTIVFGFQKSATPTFHFVSVCSTEQTFKRRKIRVLDPGLTSRSPSTSVSTVQIGARPASVRALLWDTRVKREQVFGWEKSLVSRRFRTTTASSSGPLTMKSSIPQASLPQLAQLPNSVGMLVRLYTLSN